MNFDTNNVIRFKKPKTDRDRQIDVLKNLVEQLERGSEGDVSSFACFVMRRVERSPEADPSDEIDGLSFEFVAGSAGHPAFVSFLDAMTLRARFGNMANFFGEAEEEIYFDDNDDDED